jgi:hypothetical protein
MSPEGNKAIFLRLVRELRNGNLSIVDEVCSPDFAFHSPNFPRWQHGLEGAKQLILAGPSMFSESQSTLDEIFAADDKVVVRFTIRGRYIGEVKNGFPKPGELFAMGAVAIYRFSRWKDSRRLGHSGLLPNGDRRPLGIKPLGLAGAVPRRPRLRYRGCFRNRNIEERLHGWALFRGLEGG